MTRMSKGGNVALPTTSVRAVLRWRPGPGVPDVDISALLLGAGGKVTSDDDFVFFNQPVHPSGAVRRGDKSAGTDVIDADLAAVPASVERVVLAASADGGAGGTFGAVPGLELVVTSRAGEAIAEFVMSATTETAFLAGEFYRRDGDWKLRAVGQGYDSGLAGLATDFGIDVGGDGGDPAPPPPTAPVGAPTLDGGPVSLSKSQRVSLVKAGAPPLGRVVMGLGWDPARRGRNIDLDASCIAFDAAANKLALVWFTHKSEFGGALRHTGDNLTGAGEGDDEQIVVDLTALPAEVNSLVFTINSYSGQKFTQVSNAFCRLVEAPSGQELVRFDLSDSRPNTGVIMAMLRRTGPAWEMSAIGEFHDGRTVKKMVDPAALHAAAP